MAKEPITQSDIELSKQSQIAQGDPTRSAISFNHVLQTGEIPRSKDLGDNQKFNWGPNGGDYTQPPHDSLTQAIADVREAVKVAIANDPDMQALLADPNWSEGDRVAWERGLTEIVSEELDKIPGLDQYTVTGGEGKRYAENRASTFNSISEDLDNGTNKWEVDCETFSAIKGSIMQMVENETLPKVENPDPSNLKFAADYFYATGNVFFGPSSGYGGHAFVMSSVTGNIIETTADPSSPYGDSPYRITNGRFADFIAGKQLITGAIDDPADISVYGQKASAGEEQTKLDQRLEAIRRGDYDFLGRQENRFDWDAGDIAKNHYAAMYNQGHNHTLTIPPVTPGEADPSTLLAQLRREAPSPILYENERTYLIESYKAFIENNEELQNGASIVFRSENDKYDILVTMLPNGDFELRNITGMDRPDLPTVTYTNEYEVPVIPRPQAPEPGEPLPQMPFTPGPSAEPDPVEPVKPDPVKPDPVEPDPVEPEPELPVDKGQHIVQRGDNLWNIAKQHYKDEITELQEGGLTRNQAIQEIVEEIAQANGLGNGTDANTIHPGQAITLPNTGNSLDADLNWNALDQQTAQRQATIERSTFDGDRFESHFRIAAENGPGQLPATFAYAHNQGLAHASSEQIIEALLDNSGPKTDNFGIGS